MGNCFKSSSSDGISLLRENNPPESERYDSRLVSNNSQREHLIPSEMDRRIDSSLFPSSNTGSLPVYHPAPGINRSPQQLTEDEQIVIAKRLGLIHHLPTGSYDGSTKKAKECVICMGEFIVGDALRYLPCLHTYHKECIDDWLMRSFTCPSCMEPVDAALLSFYGNS